MKSIAELASFLKIQLNVKLQLQSNLKACLGDFVPSKVLSLGKAGCDLALHCNGNINEMNMIAKRIKEEFKPIAIPDAIKDTYNLPVSIHTDKVESEFEYLLSQV